MPGGEVILIFPVRTIELLDECLQIVFPSLLLFWISSLPTSSCLKSMKLVGCWLGWVIGEPWVSVEEGLERTLWWRHCPDVGLRWASRSGPYETLKVYWGVRLLFKYSPLPLKRGEKIWTRDAHWMNESCASFPVILLLNLFSHFSHNNGNWSWDYPHTIRSRLSDVSGRTQGFLFALSNRQLPSFISSYWILKHDG